MILGIIWGWMQLFLAIISGIISFFWFVHIFVYNAARASIFLNAFFMALDSAWGLLGTIAYGIFSFYLLFTVIKGNFKFGLRIPLLIQIHPMKINGTMMNSFLFNVLLMLFSSITVVQFCSGAFRVYTRFTGIDVIFNVGIRNLRGLRYLWTYYVWVWFAMFVLTLIYMGVAPSDKKAARKGMIELKLPSQKEIDKISA
jgi:LMBR1 domain-containing protein 1